MATNNLKRYANAAVRAAREAGSLLVKHVGEPTRVETKRSIIDLVTDIDRGSEMLIRQMLDRSCPNFGFLGEEHGHTREKSPYRWIVDPLDGTMNFVHGIPFFGVSIGLEFKGRMVVGVIYDPCRKEMFVAVRGKGITLNGKPISVSRARLLTHSVLSTGFSANFRKRQEPYLSWFSNFERRAHAVRRMGSTALCLAYVAAGRMEGFYEQDLWPWDIAAGVLLVEEAGGKCSNFEGRSVKLEEGRLVASNERIHRQILNVLKKKR